MKGEKVEGNGKRNGLRGKGRRQAEVGKSKKESV